MFLDLAGLGLTALAAASISLTVTRSRIASGPRGWVQARSAWAGKLVSCPYCFSHWVALMLVLVQGWPGWLGLVLGTFAVVTLAAPLQWLIFASISAITEVP